MNRALRPLLLLCSALLASVSASGQLVFCERSATAPVAADDYVPWPGGAITIDVLGNDYDADGDILSIASFSPAAHGTVALSDDGDALVYTPTDSSAVSDDFSYSISDGSISATGHVHLSLLPAAPPPSPPPSARVWFDYQCDHLTCFFNSHFENIDDVPRFTTWVWGDGRTTPNWTSLGALHDYTPGTWNATVTIIFASGRSVTSAAAPVRVETPHVECTFSLPPVPTGAINPQSSLQFTTRLTYTWPAAAARPVLSRPLAGVRAGTRLRNTSARVRMPNTPRRPSTVGWSRNRW